MFFAMNPRAMERKYVQWQGKMFQCCQFSKVQASICAEQYGCKQLPHGFESLLHQSLLSIAYYHQPLTGTDVAKIVTLER
jgi:hypothetical protein